MFENSQQAIAKMEAHQQMIQREADMERLAGIVQSNQPTWRTKALANLGGVLINAGTRLKSRYESSGGELQVLSSKF